MDDADRADERIQNMIDDGMARAKQAMDNPRLRPIIQEIDGHRYGLCHYCMSNIAPGHLFCPVDVDEPENSCSAMAEHERLRKRDMGQ
jgi:hypothetical protein